MKGSTWMFGVFMALLALSAVAIAEEKKDSCPDQLVQWRSMAGSYNNDYNRKVQELAQKDHQIMLLTQKVRAYEEVAKKAEKPEAK